MVLLLAAGALVEEDDDNNADVEAIFGFGERAGFGRVEGFRDVGGFLLPLAPLPPLDKVAIFESETPFFLSKTFFLFFPRIGSVAEKTLPAPPAVVEST